MAERKYFYSKDVEGLEEYDDKNGENDDHKYHYEVLPHAFFGDITSAKVIFLAKNPSYAEYDDEYDDWLYLKSFNMNHEDVIFNLDIYSKDYEDDLKKVNFFGDFSDENNSCYYTTWKWWRTNVIKGAKCGGKNNISANQVAFVNISGYQSKKYKSHDYTSDKNKNNWFGSSIEKQTLLNQILKDDVYVVIVWGRKEWSRFLYEDKKYDFFKEKRMGNILF